METFRLWLEAKRRKDSAAQLMLFQDPEQDKEAVPEPSPLPAANKITSKSTRAQSILALDLVNLSRKNPEQKFTIQKFGRTLSLKDIHPMYDNGRVVGYDDHGHRYLVSKRTLDHVTYFPDIIVPQHIGWSKP